MNKTYYLLCVLGLSMVACSKKPDYQKLQSFVHFPEEGIIYEGDFLHIPYDNELPDYVPATASIFMNYIETQDLRYYRIVAHHRNANISPKVVRRYYQNI